MSISTCCWVRCSCQSIFCVAESVYATRSNVPPTATPATATAGGHGVLVHADQVDVEHQRCVGWHELADASTAVAQPGRDQQGALAAHVHALDALVPAGDDLAFAEGEGNGLAMI